MKRLARTELVLENCQEHLAGESHGTDDVVKSYLAQYLLVVLCADIQIAVSEILRKRTSLVKDNELEQFVVSVGEKIVRSVGKKELAGFLSYFGKERKDKFNNLLDEKEVNYYSNAVSNRHRVAHKDGANISFEDVQKAIKSSHHVLEAMEKALDLTMEMN